MIPPNPRPQAMPVPRPTRRAVFRYGFAFACLLDLPSFAQVNEAQPAMSEAEIDRLRDVAPEPQQRLLAFISFLDKRANAIEKLVSGSRHPGREQDIHDLMEQFNSICDDLGDNLDDYSRRHRDVRKVLPKLISASERWATVLRTPPQDERYNIARKLALTSLGDVQDSARQMVEEQRTYFQTHSPNEEASGAG